LYIDTHDGRALVIERKSISWPESYAHGHSKDHELANAISEGLSGLEFPNSYSLEMPSISSGSKAELTEAGRSVAEQIRTSYAELQRGQSLNIECLGHSLTFKLRPLEDRGDDEPDRGLVMTWAMSAPLFRTDDLNSKLGVQIKKMYAACVRKFAGYSDARRILMLDPHGEVAFTSARTWNEVFTSDPPPEAIEEIWIGAHGSDGFGGEEWVIEKVYGGNLEFPCLPIPVAD
jgi:hypothetical protein